MTDRLSRTASGHDDAEPIATCGSSPFTEGLGPRAASRKQWSARSVLTQAERKPVFDGLPDRVVLSSKHDTVVTVPDERTKLRFRLSLGSARATPHGSLAPAVIPDRCRRDPPLTSLVPTQATVTVGPACHAAPSSEET